MAVTKKQLANLKPFKPGNKANPEGARAHDPEKKMLKKITAEVFAEIVELALKNDIIGLTKVAEDKTCPAIKVGVARALMKAIQKGDWKTIEGIIERLVGKVVIKVDHTSGGEVIANPPQVVMYIPNNNRTKEENDGSN